MAELGGATKWRARRAARRMLGRRAEVLDESLDGNPLVMVGPHRLALRTGGDLHFRLVVNCPTCGRPLMGRSVKIRSQSDLDDAVAALELADPLCPVCSANGPRSSGSG